MELTEKAKEAFIEWFKEKTKFNYSANYLLVIQQITNSEDGRLDLHLFNCSPPEMKWGVYQDFFDSVGIHIKTSVVKNRGWFPEGFYNDFEDYFTGAETFYNTRSEARKEAIEQACKIFNERK